MKAHPIACIAREAAARFARGARRPGATRDAWRPLPLRWMRWRKAPAPAKLAIHALVAARVDMHMHLALHPVVMRATELRSHEVHARLHSERFERSRTTVMIGARRRASADPLATSPALARATVSCRHIAVATTRRPVTAPPARVRAGRLFTAIMAHSSSRATRAPLLRNPTSQPTQRPHSPDTPTVPHPAALRVPAARHLAAQPRRDLASPPGSPRTRGAAVPLPLSTPQLTWRKARLSESVRVADEAAGARTVAPITQRAALAAPAMPPAGPVSVAAPRASALAESIDPAFVDRIAEHVMQRVEKRVRIERERRGL